MKTMWAIAKQTPNGKLTVVANGQVWANKMTALRHYNIMRPTMQEKCQIVEVPASVKNKVHALLVFLHEDAETRQKILAD